MPPATNESAQVLIVGAGPAGAAAGIVLARQGFDVCVVDRACFPRPKTCGDALSNRAVRIVENLLGSQAAVDALPHTPVLGAEVVFPNGSRVVRSYDEPGRIVPRTHLDAALAQALVGAGARVVEGVAIRTLERDATSGRFSGAVSADRRWRAEVVLAADGPGSVGRKALRAVAPRGRRLGVAATAYHASEGPADGVAQHSLELELPHGYGWIFPAVQGLANVGIYQRFDFAHRDSVPLRRRLEGFLERQGLDPAAIRGRIRVWPLPLCTSPKVPGAPGLLLAGDAAGLVDPLSGEGIWQALRSGVLAGRTIASALASPEGLSRRWVRRYQRACSREIAWPSIVRGRVRGLLHQTVRYGLYGTPAVRKLAEWAYRRGSFEISKRI